MTALGTAATAALARLVHGLRGARACVRLRGHRRVDSISPRDYDCASANIARACALPFACVGTQSCGVNHE